MRKKLFNSTYFQESINSLNSILIKNKTSNEFAIGIMIPFGGNISSYNVDDISMKTGIAHFLEHRLFASINGDVTSLCEKYSLNCNAQTSFNSTFYYIYGPKDKIQIALKLLFDMIFNIKRNDKELIKEKKVILEEKKYIKTDYIDDYLDYSNKFIFRNTPLSKHIIGSSKDIKSTTYDDLILAYEAFYDASKMTFIAVGNISFSKIISYVKNYKFKKFHHNIKLKKFQRIYKNEKRIIYRNLEENNFVLTYIIDKKSINNKKNYIDYLSFLNYYFYNSSVIENLKNQNIIPNDTVFFYEFNEFYITLKTYGVYVNGEEKILKNDYFDKLDSLISEKDIDLFYKSRFYSALLDFDNILNLMFFVKNSVYYNIDILKYYNGKQKIDMKTCKELSSLIKSADKKLLLIKKRK